MLATGPLPLHEVFMDKKFPFNIPAITGPAWARYKRLMRFMFAVTVAVVVIALTLMYLKVGMVSPHFFIATGLGIGFAMLLTSALMGLSFLSSSTGHDGEIDGQPNQEGRHDEGSAADIPADESDQPKS